MNILNGLSDDEKAATISLRSLVNNLSFEEARNVFAEACANYSKKKLQETLIDTMLIISGKRPEENNDQ